jgi:hypothetical protein
MSTEPGLAHIGFHLVVGDLSQRLYLVPSLDIGVRHDATQVALMLDSRFRLLGPSRVWNPYVGVGAGPVLTSRVGHDNQPELGTRVLAGVTYEPVGPRDAFFLEIGFGLTNMPEIAVNAGWCFRWESQPRQPS